MTAPEKLAALVNLLVIPDKPAAKENVDQAATARMLAALWDGGRDTYVGLVDLLTEPGQADDSKARYALHALAVRAGGQKDAKARRAFAEALAATLDDKRPKAVQGFVVRQLQVAGGKEVTPALGKLLTDEDLCDDAAQALLAIKDGAAEQFRAALPKSTGKARLTAVHALGQLRDGPSAAALRPLAADPDAAVRQAAVRALAEVGDPGAVDVLLKASGAAGYERVKAAAACLLLAERLAAAGNTRDAARVYAHLRDTRTEPSEAHVREAAARGLADVK